MREFVYKDGKAELKFSLPHSKYTSSFKIDTGASLTALHADEFKKFFPSKDIEDIMDGKYICLHSASGHRMEGYTHKVLIKVAGCKKNLMMDICFYNGLRALLGMDMIQKHFKMCFEKDKYFVKVN